MDTETSNSSERNEAYERYMARKNGHTPNIDQNEGMRHGVFTQIAYYVAWLSAIGGTLVGCVVFLEGAMASRYSVNEGAMLVGATVIALSWVSASGIGTLAEISKKLTRENSKS